MDPIKIIIAEDHAIFRSSLIMALKRYKTELDVIGEAANGQQLVELVPVLKPDVIVTDIQMPVMDGLQAVKIIKEQHPEIGVIALSLLSDVSVIKGMIKAGVDGYLLKNCNMEDLVMAIQEVFKGHTYFDNEIANYLLKN
ncbi:MAG TPA: response regulator transcription factor [Flavisolibacter sp.]|nr:response regulator transcription factor [Flavisolibacter sp.]HZI01477.1 response regulator transcription factor [Flavisolibacter sp.]